MVRIAEEERPISVDALRADLAESRLREMKLAEEVSELKDSIDAGLLEVLDGPHTGRRAYWLVAPTPQWRTKKVRALVAFLSE